MQAIAGRARPAVRDGLDVTQDRTFEPSGLSTGSGSGTGVCSAGVSGLADLVRAERRVLDAEAEFDAVLDAGGSMLALGVCDRELTLAVVARDALLRVVAAPRGR